MSEKLPVHRAFGAAYEKDGLMVIPVALVGGGRAAAKGRCPRTRVETTSGAEDERRYSSWPESVMGSGSGGGLGDLITCPLEPT